MFRKLEYWEFRSWMFRLLIYVAIITLGFPLILSAIVSVVSGGQCGGGACGALVLVFGIYGKAPLVFIAVVGFIFLVAKRIRREIAWIWVAYALVIALGAQSALFAFGNFWGANFAFGLLFTPLMPLLVAAVFATILAFDLSQASSQDGSVADIKGPGAFPIGRIYAITAFLVVFEIAVRSFVFASMFGTGTSGVKTILDYLGEPVGQIFLGFIFNQVGSVSNIAAGLILIATLFRRNGAGDGNSVGTPPTTAPNFGSPAKTGFGRRKFPV
jgi:hypothetical protein